MEKALGIYDGEIFFVEGKMEDGKFIPKFSSNFVVIRYVSKDRLDELHDFDTLLDDYDYQCLWREAVQARATLSSYEDWIKEIFNDEDDGDEMFIGKDDSFVEYLTDEERELADNFILEHDDVEVGTWEGSGCYRPTSSCAKTSFQKFDFEFDKELCSQYYAYIKSKEKI